MRVEPIREQKLYTFGPGLICYICGGRCDSALHVVPAQSQLLEGRGRYRLPCCASCAEMWKLRNDERGELDGG
jgi:hypothetical protein